MTSTSSATSATVVNLDIAITYGTGDNTATATMGYISASITIPFTEYYFN
ncbi:hypothetical protein [uncultured Cyclobacterium sp.]